MSLPKFNFSNASIKTSEELVAAGGGGKEKEEKYFRPGQYEVSVSNVVLQGPANDPNWHKVLLTLEGVGGKTITHQVMIPVGDVQYRTKEGKTTLFIFQKFCKFMAALGVEVKVETLQDTMIKYFSNPEKTLKGQRFTIDVGYQGNHIRYDGKDAAGNKQYRIVKADGSTVNDELGQPVTLGDWAAAENLATQQGIEITKFCDVLNISKSASATAKVVNGKW